VSEFNAAQRAALQWAAGASRHSGAPEVQAHHGIFCALLAESSGAEACEWTLDVCDCKWDSACGESWVFNDGGPVENCVKFCQGCGMPVVIAASRTGDDISEKSKC
jgi:hypothetical protein